MDNTKELGIQWASSSANGIGLIDFTGSLSTVLTNTTPIIGKGATIGVGKHNSTTKKGFSAVLTALNQQGNVNILSTPSIVTIDNEEAAILVGEKVPFITNKQIVDGNSNPFQNYERKDVGIKLKVKPQINDDDTIKLDIEQEISKVTSQGGASDLVTSKRTIKTSVMVANKKILVFVGLIDDTINSSQSSAPLLGDIPILGHLFKYSSKKKVKRNLLIFIHPTILTDQLVADSIGMEKYKYIYAQQLLNDIELPIKPPKEEQPLENPIKPQVSTVTNAIKAQSIEELYPWITYDE
ncbi:type II secretion system protein GspD [Abyssogena phaseoliformis symbiont]|uniref:type II secretion system protein GspD n=1 Tax=Abyssogena phaseoliformis symbiont TaxID=596095 RepID=UPI001CED5A00|nr:hypothetical protein [Abyssogena phaseoliformis symbiont]